MDEVIQLFSFFVSFCIGFVFSIVTKFHFKLVGSYPKILQYLLTFLYVIDFVLLYVILIIYCFFNISKKVLFRANASLVIERTSTI